MRRQTSRARWCRGGADLLLLGEGGHQPAPSAVSSEAAMASRAAALACSQAGLVAGDSTRPASPRRVRQGCRAAPPSAPRRSRRRPAAIRQLRAELVADGSWRASAVLQVSATVVTVLPKRAEARRAGLLRARRGRVAGAAFFGHRLGGPGQGLLHAGVALIDRCQQRGRALLEVSARRQRPPSRWPSLSPLRSWRASAALRYPRRSTVVSKRAASPSS